MPLAAVVAFGRLIKPHVLERVPMVNLHYSLLPRWRGAAPVERPSWRATTGRGRVSWRWWTSWTQATSTREEVGIGPEDTADDVQARLTDAGTALLVRTLDQGLPEPTPQAGEPAAEKITPEDLHLDWTRPAVELHRLIRVVARGPRSGRRLKVWRAQIEDDGGLPQGGSMAGWSARATVGWRSGGP